MNSVRPQKEPVINSGNRRNGKIDLLRFVFSVCIALMHFGTSIGDARFFPKAGLCVEFFFLVSGYLMAKHVAVITGRVKGSDWNHSHISGRNFFHCARKSSSHS